MNWKQFLAEKVLREPEAASEYIVANNGDLVSVKTVIKNRTFDNRNDLLDLYEAIHRDGKWDELEEFALTEFQVDNPDAIASEHILSEYIAWLFCLNGKDYKDRCKMIAEFYEGGGNDFAFNNNK
jgi:hypothetical protein